MFALLLFLHIFNRMVKYSSRLLDRTFGALADPTRRRILEQLSKGEGCVTDLARPHAMSLAAVSKHLSVLEKAGLVKRRREGRVHSLALRLARVAHGELDAAIAGGNGHDWDLAAADLLVHEAGGVMTALDGRPLIYNRPEPVHGVLIAAGRERHAALVDLVRAQTSEPG